MSSNIYEQYCVFCKYVDKDEGRCKKRRKLLSDVGDITTCIFFDNSIYQHFIEFYNNEWDENKGYYTTDFTDKFGISRHLARHYLFKIMVVREKLLFRIKEFNKATYFKRTDENLAKMKSVMHKGAVLED